VATLKKLEEQRTELEDRLNAGDVSAEVELERVDAAIRSRLLKIQHSQKKLAAVKSAVGKGMSVEQAKAVKPRSAAQAKAIASKRKPLNKFE
jgi:hypothetical protein